MATLVILSLGGWVGWLRTLVAIAVAGALTIGTSAEGHPVARADTAASLKPALFVAPTGNDGGRCTRAAPCASWSRAYQLASPGEVVEVAGGTYPNQVVEPRRDLRGKTCSFANRSTCVTFVPAAGARVAINGNLILTGSDVFVAGTATPATGVPSRSRRFNISVSGFTSVEASAETDWPDHVVVRGVDTSTFAVGGADNVVLKDMDVGPSTLDYAGDCTAIENRIGLNGESSHETHNLLLDGLLIHNQNRTLAAADNDCHYGGLLLISGSGITLRNSVFSQNVIYNVEIQNFVGSPASNVLIENNWFGCSVGQLFEPNGPNTCNQQEDLQFSASSRFANWLIRYNSFAGGIGQYNPGETYSNVRIVGNVGSAPSENMCQPGVTFAYNAWFNGKQCSKLDVFMLRDPFVSSEPGREDLALRRGTKAAGLVAGKGRDYTLPLDIAGQMRPTRLAPDAGATQAETAALVLPRSIGEASLGEKRADIVGFYGRPRHSATRRRPTGGSLRVDAYRGHGSLSVTYDGDTVVGIATSSPYYTTLNGFGAGSPAQGAELRGARWVDCRTAFRKPMGGAVVYFTTDPKQRVVRAVSIIRRSFDAKCPSKHP